MEKNIEEFLRNVSQEELENLVKDYFNIMDGIWHEGNISEPLEEEIKRRDTLTSKYKIFN